MMRDDTDHNYYDNHNNDDDDHGEDDNTDDDEEVDELVLEALRSCCVGRCVASLSLEGEASLK